MGSHWFCEGGTFDEPLAWRMNGAPVRGRDAVYSVKGRIPQLIKSACRCGSALARFVLALPFLQAVVTIASSLCALSQKIGIAASPRAGVELCCRSEPHARGRMHCLRPHSK